MFSFIKKCLADYVKTERQLTLLRCVIVDDYKELRKEIKKFPKEQRKQMMQYANHLALWGASLSSILKN